MEDNKLELEDFKHSNFNIRICRAHHLDSVIDLININQLKEQLLPFLLDVIINFETNEEVLLEYSRHLKDIFFLLSKQGEISSIIIKMLLILNNHEDNQVRKISFNHIKDIIQQYHSDAFIEEELLPLLNNNKDIQEQIGNCNIVPLVFNYSTSINNKSILLNIFVDYCRDDNPYIRRQAALNIKYFFKESNQFIMNISDEFFKLLSDSSELVKVSIIESSSYLIKILSAEKQKEFITNKLIGIMTHEKSWKIKVALSNLLFSICYYFDKQFNEDYFLLFLIQTLKDSEVEVRLNTLTNLQLYLNTITERTIKEKIIPLFLNDLSNDLNWNIRAANGVLILRLICQIRFDDNNTNTYYPVLSKLIKDDSFEAKYYFISKMSIVFKENNQFSSSIENIIHDYYYPILSEVMQNYNWRLRYEIEKSFYDILTIYHEWYNEIETILKYVYLFFTDNANEIRNYSLLIIELLLKVKPTLINDIWKMQVVTLDSKNYILRIFSLKSIIQLLSHSQVEHIAKEVIPAIMNMLNDNISNVRLYAYEAILFIINIENYNLFGESIKSMILNRNLSKFEDIQLKLNQLIN